MNKSKLQELCHQQSWPLPEYTTVREGPDHNPRFTATVTVNGATFQTPASECRSSKEAQNQAAKLAFDHLTASKALLQAHSLLSNAPFPQPSPGSATSDTKLDTMSSINVVPLPTNQGNVGNSRANQSSSNHENNARSAVNLYKNRLQNYAQKRNLTLPMYSCEINGPPHALRFKAKVTIAGNIFETPAFFTTLKDAEHAVAKIAFESLPADDVQEDEGLYKSLLQELAQKWGLRFPVYNTAESGPPHKPVFLSTVKIGDQSFKGQQAKTKKQAEMSAAKIAYCNLFEGRASMDDAVVSTGSPRYENMGPLVISSSTLELTLNNDLQSNGTPNANDGRPDINVKANLLNKREEVEKGQGAKVDVFPPGGEDLGLSQSVSSSLQTDATKELQAQVPSNVTDEMILNVGPKEEEIHDEQAEKIEGSDINAKRHKGTSPDHSSVIPSELPTKSVTESEITRPARRKILVRSYKPNVTYSDGPIILSDDQWVAMRVDGGQNQ